MHSLATNFHTIHGSMYMRSPYGAVPRALRRRAKNTRFVSGAAVMCASSDTSILSSRDRGSPRRYGIRRSMRLHEKHATAWLADV